MKNFNKCKIDEELKWAMDKMIELYKRGKFKELLQIVDSPDESDERIAAAAMVLQMPRDPRRI